ncbi:MAG: sortase [Clostridiales bacterium]|nr:sortase [Clostridiales bacterium]
MKSKGKRALYKFFVAIGVLLLISAASLTIYNFYDDTRAGDYVSDAIKSLSGQIPGYDLLDNSMVKNDAFDGTGTEYPDYLLNPDMPMPEKSVDGKKYVAIIKIPKLKLELPVMSKWSYDNLRDAPCRYSGSAYKDNLVIAAHNYTKHFGALTSLLIGDTVNLVDMDGNVFEYKVFALETLEPDKVKEMTSGQADLSLFTCTIGGQYRVTVRCERVNKIKIE